MAGSRRRLGGGAVKLLAMSWERWRKEAATTEGGRRGEAAATGTRECVCGERCRPPTAARGGAKTIKLTLEQNFK